jgi:RNA polymerase sigma-70 factor (ECF subfamily)
MKINEQAIISKCQQGKLEEFGQLYDKYIQKIYNFVYYKTHHKETAEDITSLVFMKAIDKINSFDSGKGNFSSWIYRITRNTIIDHYRTKKEDANIEDIWDLAGDENIERDIDTRNKLKEVEKYLEKLNPEHRDIVIMRVWQGMSHNEIADALGKTEASIKMTFSRTMQKLRQEMPLATFLYFLFLKTLI